MMVLDLRPFDIVEDVGFNKLFKFVLNPFLNPNSFGNPDKFENLEIFGYPFRSRKNFVFLTRPNISGSRTPLILLLVAVSICRKILFISLSLTSETLIIHIK